MSEWTIISYILYVEVGVTLFLCLPLPVTWRSSLARCVVSSRVLKSAQHALKVVFLVISALFVLAVKGAWELNARYHESKVYEQKDKLDQYLLRMFRHQRNVYVAGFALLLLLVLWSYYHVLTDLDTAKRRVAELEGNRKPHED